MKFSIFRNNKKREQANHERFYRRLTALNSTVKFSYKESAPYQIYSDLSPEELPFLNIPEGSYFSKKPDFTSKAYQVVMVKYNDKDYTIFGKGVSKIY